MQISSVRTLIVAAAVCSAAVGGSAAHAQTSLNLNFAAGTVGQTANAFAQAQGFGAVTFNTAVFDFDYDASGEPISGTQKWRVDTTATAPIVIANPAARGRGGINPPNALDAVFQPVLINFNRSFDSFIVTLDNDTFGFAAAQAFLLDGNGNTLQTVTFNQQTPGLQLSFFQQNARQLVLPQAAYYNRIQATAAPEPQTVALVTAAILPLMGSRRLRRRK